jgi:hypothetical protein
LGKSTINDIRWYKQRFLDETLREYD